MKTIKIDSKNIQVEQIDEIVDYLNKGKIIIYPTDTIYGIGCDATNEKAIKKIYQIKKRRKNKALLILVKSWCMAKKYAYISSKQDKYMRNFWPGPVSAILRKRELVPDVLTGGQDSVAVRMPDNEFLLKLIKKLDKPLVSTSLNISGEKSILDLRNIKKVFKDVKPDLIIDGGVLSSKKPSKIMDLRDVNNIEVIRE